MKTFEDLRREDQERKKKLQNTTSNAPNPVPSTPKLETRREEPKREERKVKENTQRNKLEEERLAFEEELEKQILTNNLEEKPSYMPYQNANKKLMRTLLISAVLLCILSIGGWFYTKNHFDALSGDNMEIMHRAISYSVLEYYQENKRYPVDMYGNIDFNLLQKRGYLTIDVEEYRSNFKFDNQYNVIRTE